MNAVLAEGLTVRHPRFGPGRVLRIDGPYVYVFFPDASSNPRDATKKLALDKCMLVPAPELDADPRLTPPPPTRTKANRGARKRVRPARPLIPFEHMVDSFLRQYPSGFADDKLIAGELGYKRDAAKLFNSCFGGSHARRLLAGNELARIADGLNRVYHATNLLSRFEVMAMSDGLTDVKAAAALLEATLTFVEAPAPESFDRLVESVDRLPAKPGGARVLSWPSATLLPFFADPSRFLMLKPKMTQVTAEAYGFDLVYSSRPNWATYERTQAFGGELLDRLGPHGAKDFIDVHSFIWVVAGAPAMRERAAAGAG